MTAKDICRVVIAAVSLLPVYGLGQKVDLPQGVWVNCDPPSAKNAVVVGPTVTAKNGSRAWVQVVSAVAPLVGMCLNTTTLWVSRGHLHPYQPIFTQSPVYPNLEGNGILSRTMRQCHGPSLSSSRKRRRNTRLAFTAL